MNKYDDIINLPHHVSSTRQPMPMENRAAQFAPFAALSGHGAALTETARITSPREVLSEDESKELSRRLMYALDRWREYPALTFTYFIPDRLKEGGRYVEITGRIKKFDEYGRQLVLTDGSSLKIDNIISINGQLFESMD